MEEFAAKKQWKRRKKFKGVLVPGKFHMERQQQIPEAEL